MNISKSSHGARDAGVELMRIYAAISVICVHTMLLGVPPQYVDHSKTLIQCFIGDGVSLFFLITGFFIFRTKDYIVLLKRTFFKVLVPAAAVIIVSTLVSRMAFDNLPFEASILSGMEYLKSGYLEVLKCNPPGMHTEHLWYICVYLLLMLLFPLYRGYAAICKRDKYVLIGIVLALMLLNDIGHNGFFKFELHSINALVPALFFFVFGEFIYPYREKFKKWYFFIGSAAVYIAVNFLRMSAVTGEPGVYIDYYLYWYSFFGVISTISLCVCAFSIPLEKLPHISSVIRYIGSKTFTIYLIHILVAEYLRHYGIQRKLFEYLHIQNGTVIHEFVYTYAFGIIVFLVSFAFAAVFSLIHTAVKKLFNKIFLAKNGGLINDKKL